MDSSEHYSHSIRQTFDTAKAAMLPSLPQNSWYILVGATLLSARGSRFYGELYDHALKDLGPVPSEEKRKQLLSRFMEVMMKSWTLVGAPSVIEAWYGLRGHLQDGDSISEISRRWEIPNSNLRQQRANEWFKTVFSEDENRIFEGFRDFSQFEWALKDVIYGIFLSDLTVLDTLENEMVVLACVAGQGAGSPVLSHYKGLRRVGTSAEEAKSVSTVIDIIARGLGIDTSQWHTAEEVESHFV